MLFTFNALKNSTPKRKAFLNPMHIRWVHKHLLAQTPAAFRVFPCKQVTPARMRTQYLAGGRNLESFGH